MSNPAWRPLLEGEESEYAAIIQLAEAERRERGCGLIEVASMEARARWEAARARHHPCWHEAARAKQPTRDSNSNAQQTTDKDFHAPLPKA